MPAPRPIPQESAGRLWLVETDDHAQLTVECFGQGRPLVLVHGWSMSRRFWRRQAAGLADRFQVVTPDLRAHGDSSKTLTGHDLFTYAGDLRRVLEALDLRDVVLAGWSLAGPLVLEYWRRFGGDRLAGLALVETTPAPLSPEPWNSHRLRGWDLEGTARFLMDLAADRVGFTQRFIHAMFHGGQAPAEELAWMTAEALKLPTGQAVAIYSDYLLRDLTPVLATIDRPALVLNGHSEFLSFGPDTAAHVAGSIPGARLAMLEGCGHLPFYEDAPRFNQTLAEFAAAC